MNRLLPVLYICFIIICCKTRSAIESPDDMTWAKLYVQGSMKDTLTKPQFKDTLIQNRQTAIEIVEPILNKHYGKSTIQKQKPFTVNQIEGYWMVRGKLKNGGTAGTFLIILRASDGKIMEMTIRQ
ncbi:MAG: NTF2 fold immunity protein [Bacteroidota bacterium]